ncbi:MAG: hypothetical protein DLM57_12950 [Pseudonocardiales bacterium]|nr:MAG: hypothetical protein DLM57_12950 [Pseudonocardiales bacterium]
MTSPEPTLIAEVEILEVTRNAHALAVLKDFSIDLPVSPTSDTGYLIEVAGWAVGTSAEVVAVDVRCDGATVSEASMHVPRPDVPAALPHLAAGSTAGFYAVVALPGLPLDFRLEVSAQLSDGRAVSLGHIIGHRSRGLPAPPRTEMNPLLVTSLGRTGTSWLLHVLGQHPAIVRHHQWGYELNAVGFFEKGFRSAVTRPHGADQPAAFASWQDGSWWGLEHPFGSPPLAAWFRGDHVQRAAAHAREQLLAFYRAVASAQGLSAPRYFAEKTRPVAAGFPLELFAEAREIILVRDFRDMVCSILEVNRRRGFKAFDAVHAATDAELPGVLQAGVELILATTRTRPGSLVVRYEDLVEQPERILARVLAYLDLADDPARITAMLTAAITPTASMAEHRTTDTAQLSVGRWRTELEPAVLAACESAFGEALTFFGYAEPRVPAVAATSRAPMTPAPITAQLASNSAGGERGAAATASLEFVTSADGRLPAVLAHTDVRVDETISPDEAMSHGDVAGYLAVGESALKAIRLALLAARAPLPAHVLDFGCGHGRVMRWLRAAFPDARLTGADIRSDGVDFCARTFAATGVYSSLTPGAELFGERYDLIWVGSLFTHLDQPRWWEFLDLLHELLAPGGVLVMTTHGELVAERMRRGAHYGYPESAVHSALDDYDHAGFGFMPADDALGSYGFSVSRPAWVVAAVLRHADLRIVSCTEAQWANHQDVLAVMRRPVDPNAASRPYT